MGRLRIRRPVAWYTAFAIATATPVTPISPAPLAPSAPPTNRQITRIWSRRSPSAFAKPCRVTWQPEWLPDDIWIRAAATDIAAHPLAYLLGGSGVPFLQQCHRRDD